MENGNDKKRMEWYLSLNTHKKIVVWLAIFYAVVFIVLIPFFTIGWLKVSLGWLIGSIASLGTIFLIDFKNKSGRLSEKAFKALVFSSIGIIWVLILVISAICTFVPKAFNGFDLFYFWTVILSALPLIVAFVVDSVLKKRRTN